MCPNKSFVFGTYEGLNATVSLFFTSLIFDRNCKLHVQAVLTLGKERVGCILSEVMLK